MSSSTPVQGVNPNPSSASTPVFTPSQRTSAPFLPPKNPRMGTCIETFIGSNSYHCLFGGTPKADWSGIQDPNQRSRSDLQFRSLDPVAGQKITLHRQKGLSKKFERKHNLTDFQDLVWDHLVKYGLETLSFLPDPKDTTKVLCVVKKHS